MTVTDIQMFDTIEGVINRILEESSEAQIVLNSGQKNASIDMDFIVNKENLRARQFFNELRWTEEDSEFLANSEQFVRIDMAVDRWNQDLEAFLGNESPPAGAKGIRKILDDFITFSIQK